MDELEILYKKFNFPGVSKLYAITKKEGKNISLKQIKEFISTKRISQLYKKIPKLNQFQS